MNNNENNNKVDFDTHELFFGNNTNSNNSQINTELNNTVPSVVDVPSTPSAIDMSTNTPPVDVSPSTLKVIDVSAMIGQNNNVESAPNELSEEEEAKRRQADPLEYYMNQITTGSLNEEHHEEKVEKKSKFNIGLIIKIVIIVCILGVGIYFGYNKLKNYYGKVLITNSEVNKLSDNYYAISEKVEKLNGKIYTISGIKSTDVKLYSGSLVLFENKYEKEKNWEINTSKLVMGVNILEFTIHYKKKDIKQIIYIYNESEENSLALDRKDSDKDGLLNYQEEIYGTDKNKIDTDGDGLSDYFEVNNTLTDPLKKNTNSNKSDGELDFDNDGLNNIEEEKNKTDPYEKDTDGDGLSDYDEVHRYKTNPLKNDSDNDGINDKDEVSLKSDPTVKNNSFNVTKKSTDKVLSVKIDNIDSKKYNSLTIEKSDSYLIDKNSKGYIAGPYNIEMNGKVSSATISFKLSTDKKNATIYYIDDNNKLKEVKTTRNNDTISANVSHFSEYVVLDKTVIDKIMKNAPSSSDNISGSSKEYVVIGFPILMAIFNYPLYIYEVNGDELILQKKQDKLNKIIENDPELKGIKVEFKSIKKAAVKIIKLLLGWLEDKVKDSYNSATGDDDYKSVFQYIVMYKHVIGSNELLDYLLGSGKNKNYVFEEKEDEDTQVDSNKDGISDYHTRLIVNGILTTQTGRNPFGDLSYDVIQKNKDYDKDGIINGEEIKIVEENEKLFIVETSSPIYKDSDNDGVNDDKDAQPLFPFNANNNFKVGDSFSKTVHLTSLEKETEEFNSLFNTGKSVFIDGENYIEYTVNNEKKYSPTSPENLAGSPVFFMTSAGAAVGNIIGAKDAHKAWSKYFEANAETYTENTLQELSLNSKGEINEKSLYGSSDVQNLLKDNINSVVNVVENTVKDGDTLVFESNKYLLGASAAHGKQNTNVFGFLHTSSAYIVAEATNNNNNYKMKLRYIIGDIYDWKSIDECNPSQPACYTEIQYFNFMLLGNAKAFLVQIEYDIEVEWEKGKSVKTTLQNGTPYKGFSLSGKF